MIGDEPPGKGEDQKDIPGMEQEIDPMIPGRMAGIAEDRVIEEVRQGGDGPIQAAFPSGPPIGMLEDQRQIVERGFVDPAVTEDESAIIEYKAGLE
jgi:hypothetical protein